MGSPSSLLRTPLYDAHRQLHARMVDFAGWDMPVQYPSGILKEHQAVREACGIFDLSHMGRVFVRGADALMLAQRCCTRDLSRVPSGSAAYSVLCESDGGIVDDVIAYVVASDEILFVFNASNRETDIAFFETHRAGLNAALYDATFETALIGVQGPDAERLLRTVYGSELPVDGYAFVRSGPNTIVARTGYTGEDGFELMLPSAEAAHVWNGLLQAGATACGLGARDTLRTEAGFALYGHEIDRSTNPFEARLGWVVDLAKPAFVGREALGQIKQRGNVRRLVGLRVAPGGVPRPGAPVLPAGQVTSGTFSPTLRANIAMAYVPVDHPAQLQVEIRGKSVVAEVTRLPFVAHRSHPRATMGA
jgi:aminomethyltransferase